MKAIGKTDRGKIRKTNQDAFKISDGLSDILWVVVCDGMGGANGGYYASSNAVRLISKNIEENYNKAMNSNQIRSLLISSVNIANVYLFETAKTTPDLYGMGTTVVAVIIKDRIAHIVHVGDSRAYLVDENGATQITRDHSVVQQLVEIGKLTESEAQTHPEKNMITRAVGVDETIDIDYLEMTLKPDDMLLICTDGLTNHVNADEINRIIKQEGPQHAPDALVQSALKQGGTDNVTVVLIS